MKVNLAYGKTGLELDLPDHTTVIEPKPQPGLVNEKDAILNALNNPINSLPLRRLVRAGQKVLIAHSDITRATPNPRILPVILTELEKAGANRNDITLVNALGTHRQHTDQEMRSLLGDWVYENFHCEQHNAFDDENLISFGVTKLGHPIRLNRRLVESDLIILTGFIEPHLFAGFSGGPKCVLPGMAGAESVITNHSIELIGHPNAKFGITHGNPLWEEMLDITRRLRNVFLLNVTLNVHKKITGVFTGDLESAHKQGCQFVRSTAMIKVQEPFDIVVTTNSGYPLDQNLYQCAKGLVAAESVVRPGGAILLVAACEDGIPAGSHYDRLIQKAASLDGIESMLNEPGFSAPDQWQMQIQARVQRKADVYVFSEGLSENEIQRTLFIPSCKLDQQIIKLQNQYGPSICVLPEGPQVIAYLE